MNDRRRPELRIGSRAVGLDHPTYFVADIAANHDGDLGRAKELIRLCAAAGADAAKFQNFRAETIVSGYGFEQLGGQRSHQSSWNDSVVNVYRKAAVPLQWTEALVKTCEEVGVDYLTALYDLDMLTALSAYMCAWKIGSGDITWHEAIRRMAAERKPMLIATGASNMDEVRMAVTVAAQHTRDIVLMQCNTNYTNDHENFRHINLRVLATYAAEFPEVVLGLSDHTPGHATVLGAVALGARVVEKHFTDDTRRAGPDHGFSMDAEAWRAMVDRTRELEMALGDSEKRVMDNERETVVLQRRAVRAAQDIPSGAVIAESSLTVLRPCPTDALPPYRVREVLGRRACRDIEAGDCVRLADVG